MSWDDYVKRRLTWDKIQQCVSLDATFYEGAEVKLCPAPWRALANRNWLRLRDRERDRPRKALGVGIDPAEGGDKTAMCAADEHGVIELVSRKTPDTNVVVGEAIAFAQRHGVDWERVYFDRGGGGKEHADRMRAAGYDVKTISFGEQVGAEKRRGMTLFPERLDTVEDRQSYRSRRAQMYYTLRLLLDPCDGEERVFALPPPGESPAAKELDHQLSVLPLLFDDEGRIWMYPKNRKDKDSKVPCLTDLIGHSPDEADALVLAVHAARNKAIGATAGAME